MKTVTHDAYVAGVQEFYRWHDIVPGDPNEGDWEDAHYPAPRALGDETIQLLKDHHIIQGLLQSEEYQRCCFYAGNTSRWLRQNTNHPLHAYLCSLYTKWVAAHTRGKAAYKDPHSGETALITHDEARDRGWVGASAGKAVYKDPATGETAQLTAEEAREREWVGINAGKSTYKNPQTGETEHLTKQVAKERGWDHINTGKAVYRNPETGETAQLHPEVAKSLGWIHISKGSVKYMNTLTQERKVCRDGEVPGGNEWVVCDSHMVGVRSAAKRCSQAVEVVGPDGEVYWFSSLSSASESLGLSKASLHRAKANRASFKGHIVRELEGANPFY